MIDHKGIEWFCEVIWATGDSNRWRICQEVMDHCSQTLWWYDI